MCACDFLFNLGLALSGVFIASYLFISLIAYSLRNK